MVNFNSLPYFRPVRDSEFRRKSDCEAEVVRQRIHEIMEAPGRDTSVAKHWFESNTLYIASSEAKRAKGLSEHFSSVIYFEISG